MPRAARQLTNGGVYEYIQRLGWRTYGKEQDGPTFIIRRPSFCYKPVNQLYQLELTSLFGRLVRDEGLFLDRKDPRLFDQELDDLLQQYGPTIWPAHGEGSRDHLREPQVGTLYPSDLVYPRDSAELKKYMREIILNKKKGANVDVDALINKTHKESKLTKFGRSSNTLRASPRKREPRSVKRSRFPDGDYFDGGARGRTAAASESRDSPVCARTRQQTQTQGNSPPLGSFRAGLRLYRMTTQLASAKTELVSSCGTLLLTEDCDTSDACFSRVSELMETDCNFMVLGFPVDMVTEQDEGRLRIVRGSTDSEATFQRALAILRKARIFPYGPSYRSIEVEVGLDLSSDDE